MKRIKRFLQRVVSAVLKPLKAIVEWIKDPDLDVVGVGVFTTYVGRTILFGSITLLYASLGFWIQAVAFCALMILDLIIHSQVLVALRKLMRYEGIDALMFALSN